MIYAVIVPCNTPSGVQDCPLLVTDDIEKAKECARSQRNNLLVRKLEDHARRVRFLSPRTPQDCLDMADRVEAYAHQRTAPNGKNFAAQDLFDWTNALRIRADELANPEAIQIT